MRLDNKFIHTKDLEKDNILVSDSAEDIMITATKLIGGFQVITYTKNKVSKDLIADSEILVDSPDGFEGYSLKN